MKRREDLQKRLQCVRVGLMCLGMIFSLPLMSNAIQPGAEQEQVVTKGTVPNIPGQRPERSIAAPQLESRKIVEQPVAAMQPQKRWADNYLAKSVWHVIDPQDGLRKDGRVAVLEGLNAQVVYQFSPEHKVVNIANQADITIYTHNKSGFDGPYNVFVASFGDTNWTQLGADVVGTSSFDLPPGMKSAELILITNRQNKATYIEAVEGFALTAGGTQGTFSYFPEGIIGLRVNLLDCSELNRAQAILMGGGMGYQLIPLGEIEVKWNSPIQNQWKVEELRIEAEGQYEVFASDSQGMENFIGRRAGGQSIDLPQNMTDVTRVRVRNHNNNQPVVIYSIIGRR